MYERLTARTSNNIAYLLKVKRDEQVVESPYPNTLKAIIESFGRLAEFEDIGLSPEEIGEKINNANEQMLNQNNEEEKQC